ncbi:MAG: FtsW/RodA/SpoVE family cell cycle protein [Bacillota bacterium]|nr:FtsW/RodA/SpoVE family cell cycle protein [Bacillota bacterium]
MESRMEDRRNKRVERKKYPDFVLILCTFVILAFGIVMIYSSSNYLELQYSKNSQKLLDDTWKWVTVGTFIFFVALFFKYTWFKKKNYLLVWLFGALIVSLLVLVLFLPPVRNVHRWIVVAGFQFQPSEFAKVALILGIAAWCERTNAWRKGYKQHFKNFIMVLLGIATVAGLVFIEPNKSTGIVIGMIGMILIFLDGASAIFVGGFGALMMSLVYLYLKMTRQMERIAVYAGDITDIQDAAWQINQSLYAFGLGGVFGAGLGNGTQNKLWLPEVVNDFILGNVGEEFGFIGVVLLLTLYLILIYRCFRIAMLAPDRFSALVCAGVGILITVHVLLNYAITTNIIPTTGITLPLVSYGGTSTMVFMGSLGLVAGISMYAED